MSRKTYPAAIDILGDAISEKRKELAELEQAFEAVGGVYEDEAAEEEPKRLTGPEAGADPGYSVLIGGKRVALTGRQAEAVQMLISAGPGGVVKIDDLAGVFGGIKQRWYGEVAAINAALAEAGHIIGNVRGLGYKLEKA